MDSKSLQSFKIELPELHCCVYVLFMQSAEEQDSGYSGVLDWLRGDIQDLGLVDGDDVQSQKQGFEELHRRLDECEANPAFTFLWDDTEVVIVLKLESFKAESRASFFGTLVHELSHAVTMLFESLGLKLDDDEHHSIVLGNLTEACFQRVFPDSRPDKKSSSHADSHYRRS